MHLQAVSYINGHMSGINDQVAGLDLRKRN